MNRIIRTLFCLTLIFCCNLVKTIDEYGRTPLHKCRTIEEFDEALQTCARINARDKYGDRPLHDLVLYAATTSGEYNSQLWTESIMRKDEKLLKKFIKCGAQINACNNNGDTPLHHIADRMPSKVALDTIQFLLRNGANPLIKNNDGYTALDIVHTIDINNNAVWCEPLDKEGRTELTKIKKEAIKSLENAQKKESLSIAWARAQETAKYMRTLEGSCLHILMHTEDSYEWLTAEQKAAFHEVSNHLPDALHDKWDQLPADLKHLRKFDPIFLNLLPKNTRKRAREE